jgi:ElaB/YqjD/DUF883 family membrane-anchored ribosome-binding protein
MGETADQLRQQVDQKRDDASQKIEQIEQQVMNTAHQVEQKVTDTAQQVKDKLDWRQQVEERPLLSLGAALIGGMVLGGIMGKDSNHQSSGQHFSTSTHTGATSPQMGAASSGGVTNALRNAARDSGLDDTIQRFASNAFSSITERVREMTDDAFPGMIDKIQKVTDKGSASSGSTTGMPRDRVAATDGPAASSSFAN